MRVSGHIDGTVTAVFPKRARMERANHGFLKQLVPALQFLS